MKLFHPNIEKTILRYYLMMLIVIAAGFLHIWPLAILALPVFLSCLLGVSFEFDAETTHAHTWSHRIISAIRKLRVPDHQTS